MKKLFISSLSIILLSFNAIAQESYVIPETTLGTQVPNTVVLDINNDTGLVTMILKGPADGWFAVGFDAVSMDPGVDVVYMTATELVDATIIGFQRPVVDVVSNDWTLTSNKVTPDGLTRIITATRKINSDDSNDFSFPDMAPQDFDMVWAYGEINTQTGMISKHTNRGSVNVSFTLGIEELFATEFSMIPNPSNNIVEIALPQSIISGTMKITNYAGQQLQKIAINGLNKRIDISGLAQGMYLVNFDTPQGKISKKLIKI